MMGLSTLPERIQSKISISPTGCWLWTGAHTSRRYGSIKWKGRARGAHCIVYELLVGDVPEGRELDHLCRERGCVNPAHLEPVSPRENTLRGSGPTANNGRMTRCHRGHELSGENVYLWRGMRHCRACRRERRQEKRDRAAGVSP